MLNTLLLLPLLAQSHPQKPPVTTTTTTTTVTATAPAQTPPAKEQEIDDIIKEYTKYPGDFTFYRLKKGTSDALYLEVPEDHLNKWLLLQATASTGTMNTPSGIFQGQPLNDLALKIKVVDDGSRVEMVAPSIENRAPESPEAQRALDREFTEEVLYSFDIKAHQKSRKSLLIDVTPMFKSDIARLSQYLKGAGGGYGFDGNNSFIDSIKVFPENAVVRTTYRLNWQGPETGQPRSIPFNVSYNLSTLPQDDYKPRIGDTRVGYFTTDFLDHSDSKNTDPRVNYIYRWRIEKADPTLALSPPKKPIVFYIDNAMPKAYRPAATEGLLLWNRAFEKIGIKDAIVVKQMPDDADWDIADVRYNVVRWTVNVPFAIALMRANPLTGEIMNASINFDSGFASSNASYFDGLNEEPTKGPDVVGKLLPSIACIYPREAQINNAFGAEAIEALDPVDAPAEKARIIYESIRETAAHEFGHCLGLRHNFIASTYLTNAQLADAATTQREGVSASVMDYNSENYEAINRPGVSYFNGVVGKYDLWAIDYGYHIYPSSTTRSELPQLRAIASHTNEPGLAFQTDEVADSYDPEVRRFDMSSDPLAWCVRTKTIADKVIANLAAHHPAPGESSYEYTRRFMLARSVGYVRPIGYAMTFIGGTALSSNYHGDANEKPVIKPISKADQKRALDLVCSMALSEKSVGITPAEASKLAANPNSAGNQPGAAQRLYPVLDIVSSQQQSALAQLLSPSKINLIQNNSYRSTDTLPLATLFAEVKDNVWSELGDGHVVTISRRELQRRHIAILSDIALGKTATAGDAKALAELQLKMLQPQIKAAAAKQTDLMQKAHYLDISEKIDRTLSAPTLAQ